MTVLKDTDTWRPSTMGKKVNERYEHDDCPKCGTPSVPFEGVPDQALRGCPNSWCLHEWWEDLDAAPHKGAWGKEVSQI